MWVKVIHPMGEVKHVDWENNYKKLRQTVNIQFPGKYFTKKEEKKLRIYFDLLFIEYLV